MITIHRSDLGLSTAFLIAGLVGACGGDAQTGDTGRAQALNVDVLDACEIVPSEAFSSLLGGAVTTNGMVDERSQGWMSNCWISGRQRILLTLNGHFEPSGTTAELIESMGSWMDKTAETFGADDIDPDASGTLEPAEGFTEPAARHYDQLMHMHIVTVQHGSYTVQVGAPDLELALEATRIALEHAP